MLDNIRCCERTDSASLTYDADARSRRALPRLDPCFSLMAERLNLGSLLSELLNSFQTTISKVKLRLVQIQIQIQAGSSA